jgi:hypothetical protein
MLVAIPLAGCAAGQGDATSHEHETPYNADAHIGALDIRDVTVWPATNATTAGSGAQAYLSMVLLGNTNDRLTSVTVAGGGQVTPVPSTATFTIQPNRVLNISDPDVPTGNPGLAINGLASPPLLGTTMQVTLTFANAGSVTVNAPVRDITST